MKKLTAPQIEAVATALKLRQTVIINKFNAGFQLSDFEKNYVACLINVRKNLATA